MSSVSRVARRVATTSVICLAAAVAYAEAPFVIESAGTPVFGLAAYNGVRDEYLVVYPDGGTSVLWARRVALRGGAGKVLGTAKMLAAGVGSDNAVAWNSNRGTYLVVWESGASILGRRVRPNGSPLGPVFTVGGACGAPFPFADDPAVAYDSKKDRWLVAWGCPSDKTIETRIVRGNGRLGISRVLFAGGAGTTATDQVSLAYDSNRSRYLAVWTAYDEAVYARRLGASGAPIGGPIILGSAPSGGGFGVPTPNVVYSPRGRRWLVVLVDTSGVTDTLTGRFVFPDGSVRAPFPISDGGADVEGPTVAFSAAANRYLAAWSEAGIGDVYGQRLAAAGKLRGPNFGIAATAAAEIVPTATPYFAACAESQPRCLVVWTTVGASTELMGKFVK